MSNRDLDEREFDRVMNVMVEPCTVTSIEEMSGVKEAAFILAALRQEGLVVRKPLDEHLWFLTHKGRRKVRDR